MIALALEIEGFPAYTLKLVSAVIVVAALSVPAVKEQIAIAKLKREAKRNA